MSLHALGCQKLLTTKPDPGERFDTPLPGLGNGELGDFQAGHTQFRKAFSIAEGLGPIFNNVSCASCHSGDGRGRPENVLTRFSRGVDLVPGEGGPQIQDKAIPGATPERLPAGVDVSYRMPPPVFGVGLIEAIPDSAILSHEDPGDADGDGISGRANMVTPAPYVPSTEPGGGPGPRVGRFGRKAQVSSLLQQTVEAYHQDIGMTSSYRPVENVNPVASHPAIDPAADPELSDREVEAVMQYMRMLAPPAPGEPTASRARGEALFSSAQCVRCHVPTLHTGPHEIETLANRDVTLYSDLLLHDLGDALADNRPDGSADGKEWRTAPLWGLRVAREFLNGQLFLLHDGRAHSVDEAIRFHGGEATAAHDAYLGMSAADRAA
ncbi:MAG TPA: di-heme oxidoredictase family protein, partial [Candidatus Angelobacter sp.]|nr:di-heme oxidoredictase family protein [Candidatus Angelobacter sp.]